MTLKFSIPLFEESRFFDLLKQYNASIAEVWVLSPDHPQQSGRTADLPFDRLLKIQRALSERGLRLKLLIEGRPYISRKWPPLDALIQKLSEQGELALSVSDQILAIYLRTHFPNLFLSISPQALVSSQSEAKQWQAIAGAQAISLARGINKKPTQIAAIRELGLEIELLPQSNDDAASLMEHVSFTTGGSDPNSRRVSDFEKARTIIWRHIRQRQPVWSYIRTDVLPFQLPKFEDRVDLIRLSEPTGGIDGLARSLNYFLDMKDDVHPVYGYREPAGSLETLDNCRHNCDSCGWCAENCEVVYPRTDASAPMIAELEWAFRIFGLNASDATAEAGHRSRQVEPKSERNPETGPTEDRQDKRVGADESDDLTGNWYSGISGIHEFRKEAEAADKKNLLGLLLLFIERCGDILKRKSGLLGRFQFDAIGSTFEDALTVRFKAGTEQLTLALVPLSYSGQVALKTFHIGVIFLDDACSTGVKASYTLLEEELKRRFA